MMANNTFSKLKKLQESALALFHERGLEREDVTRHSRLLRTAHFWMLVCRSFARNRCPVRASALAFSSLLALIPMLAVAFSISTLILKNQGEEPVRLLVKKTVEALAPYTGAAAPDDARSAAVREQAATKLDEAVQHINGFIQNTQSKTIGGIGMVALVIVALSMLMRIEATFNDIWGVTRGRTWYTQVVLYWAVITLGPVLMVLALGLTGGSQVAATRQWLMHWPWFGGLIFKLIPVLVLMALFWMLYQLMPNTRVRPAAAATGALVAGVLWHANSALGVHFVSRVTESNAIYGSVGMIPVFMLGMYFSWLILLFGAQVSYAFQNRVAYLQDKQTESVNQRGRELTALRLMAVVGRRFAEGAPAPSPTTLAETLGVPLKLVSQVVRPLIAAKLVAEVQEADCGYAPGRPLNQITAHDILHSLRAAQGQDFAAVDDPLQARVLGEFERIAQAEQGVASAITLEDLVRQPK